MTRFTHLCARCSQSPVDFENEYCGPCHKAMVIEAFGLPAERFVALLGTIEDKTVRNSLKMIYYHKLYGSNKNIKQILGENFNGPT